jgi:hypothetical protein
MKRVFLLMVVSALLVTFGLAQTLEAGSNTDSANVKGCLGGSDGNYTVVEDGSRQIFKITTSSVDLKPHVGHDVKLIGHKVSGAVSSGGADNSFAVAELSMISEHCVAADAATVGAVVPYSQTVVEPTTATPAPSAPASTPAVDAAAPAATANPSAATVSAPAVDAAAPAATVSPSSATVSTPAVDAAAPAATVSPSSATVSTGAANAAHPTRSSAHPRKLSATQAAAATASAATVSPSSETVRHTAADAAADAAKPATTASSSSETASAPAAAATTPIVTHRAGSLPLLISFAVLVIVLGTLVPLLLRWRKRKMLERTGAQNLSFTNEASSDRDKPELRKVA